VAVAVVGGQGLEIVWSQGYSPVKQKTSAFALIIDPVFETLVGGVVGICKGWV
jgi:hypothetical protein